MAPIYTMGEVLSERRKNIESEFHNSFEGMTDAPVTLAELLAAQDALLHDIVGDMPERHREFLIGFEKGAPDWSLLTIPHAVLLPAVLWRQQNLDTRSAEQRSNLVRLLELSLNRRE